MPVVIVLVNEAVVVNEVAVASVVRRVNVDALRARGGRRSYRLQ